MRRSWTALLLAMACVVVVAWSLSRSHTRDAALEGASLTQDGSRATGALDRPSDSPAAAAEQSTPAADRRVAAERGAPPIVDASGVLHCIVQFANGEPVPDIRVSGQDGSRWIDATTDRWGRVRFESIKDASAIGAFHLYGSSLLTLHRSTPHARPDGSWTPLVITLMQAAEISLRLLTEAGTALPDREVSVALSPDEPLGRRRSDLSGRPQLPLRRGMTDEDGRATIRGVPAGMRLVVRVDDATFEWWNPANGRLTRSRKRAVPLVLANGHRMELVLRLGTLVRINGKLMLPDGSPPGTAEVDVFLDREPELGRELGSASVSTDGSFEFHQIVNEPVSEVYLHARSRIPHGSWFDVDPFGADSMSEGTPLQPQLDDEPTGAMVRVPLDALGNATGLEITLREFEEISGTVRDPEGGPVNAYITLHSGEVSIRSPKRGQGTRWTETPHWEDGIRFRFSQVLPGEYEVEAWAPGYRSARRSDVAAGTQDVDLVLVPESPAKITVYVHGPDVSFAGQLRYLQHTQDSAEAVMATPLNGKIDLREDWEVSADGLGHGARWSWSDGGVIWFDRLSKQKRALDPRGTKIELQPGVFSFRVLGAFSSKGWNHPMSSPPVRIESGTSEIHFYLRGAGRVNGVVRGARSDMALCVALALENGVLLTLDIGRDELRDWSGLSSTGEFRWDSVPEGPCELRVGTRDVLQAGGALLRRSIEVIAGEELQLELQL